MSQNILNRIIICRSYVIANSERVLHLPLVQLDRFAFRNYKSVGSHKRPSVFSMENIHMVHTYMVQLRIQDIRGRDLHLSADPIKIFDGQNL